MTELRDVRLDPSLCADVLRKAVESAARAASASAKPGPDSASAAMDQALADSRLCARLFLGEGPAQDFPALHDGRLYGPAGQAPEWDLIADPADGAGFTGPGRSNALACLAAAPPGTLYDPGPVFYMEKSVFPPAAKGAIAPDAPVADQLTRLARLLDKRPEHLTVYVQEKPRHRDLIAAISAAGAKPALYPAGDVAGAVAASIPGSGIDAMMGVGGAREGLIAACAVKMLGGDFFARPAPQLATERRAVEAAGIDTARRLDLGDLIRAERVLFCAAGITDGLLLDGVRRDHASLRLQSLLIGAPDCRRQILTTWRDL